MGYISDITRSALTDRAKLVMITLLDNHNYDQGLQLTNTLLAKELNASTDYVKRGMRELHAEKYVYTKKVGKNNKHYILWDNFTTLKPAKVADNGQGAILHPIVSNQARNEGFQQGAHEAPMIGCTAAPYEEEVTASKVLEDKDLLQEILNNLSCTQAHALTALREKRIENREENIKDKKKEEEKTIKIKSYDYRMDSKSKIIFKEEDEVTRDEFMQSLGCADKTTSEIELAVTHVCKMKHYENLDKGKLDLTKHSGRFIVDFIRGRFSYKDSYYFHLLAQLLEDKSGRELSDVFSDPKCRKWRYSRGVARVADLAKRLYEEGQLKSFADWYVDHNSRFGYSLDTISNPSCINAFKGFTGDRIKYLLAN